MNEEPFLPRHNLVGAMSDGEKTREWASIATVPVVPLASLRRGVSAEEAVREQYPGRFEGMRIVVLRRLSAAVLVPRERQIRAEMQLPVPALALNRRRDLREGLFQAATARGFDLYRLRRRQLLEVRSTRERTSNALDLGVPRSLRGLRAIDHVRSGRGHGVNTGHAALAIFAVALATRVVADGIAPPPSTTVERQALRESLPQSSRAGLRTIDPLVETLIDLAGAVPGFSLRALELGNHRAVVRFLSGAPIGETVTALEAVVPAEWHRAVEREGGATTVVLEADYE
jgi:hypothetical protein